MPPTTTGTSSRPASFMRAITSCTSGTCEPERIDRPTTCTRFFAPPPRRSPPASGGCRRRPRPCRRRARATAICSAPLEWPSRPGLPTRNFSRRPSFFDTRSTSARMSSRPSASLRMARADAGRRAVFAERLAQRKAPFAGGDAGFGAGDRGRHDVAAACAAACASSSSAAATAALSRAARQACKPRDLIGLGLRPTR